MASRPADPFESRHGVARQPSGGARAAAADGRARGCHARRGGGVRRHRRHLPGHLRRHLPRARVRVPRAIRDGEDGVVTRPGGDGHRARRRARSHGARAALPRADRRIRARLPQGPSVDRRAVAPVERALVSRRLAEPRRTCSRAHRTWPTWVPDAISGMLGLAGAGFSVFIAAFTILFTCLFLLSDIGNLKGALASVLDARRRRAVAGCVGARDGVGLAVGDRGDRDRTHRRHDAGGDGVAARLELRGRARRDRRACST